MSCSSHRKSIHSRRQVELADVSASLPRALADLGVDIRLILPGYPQALRAATDKTVIAVLRDRWGSGVTRLVSARMPDSRLPVWLVDCPELFNRDGGPYQDEHGRDWPDNAQRFAHLSAIAAKIATGKLIPDWRADVVHGNDWHTGLLPILVNGCEYQRPATLFTIHNLAFQGLFPAATMSTLDLPESLFTPAGIEFYGHMSYLKAGIRFSDRLTTVSPSYAREILTAEGGCGLDDLLRDRAADTVGIDYEIWDPSSDSYLPATYGSKDLAGKAVCKARLQSDLGLTSAPHTPLIIWVSRIAHQKMADIALDAIPAMLERNIQVAVLGQGEVALEDRFRRLGELFPGRMAVRIGYEQQLAHRLYAGGDILLHPSRFEPCGLTPLYALRYGTIPVVRHVGGLADTIVDATVDTIRADTATGFAFHEETAGGLLDCVDRALEIYQQSAMWRRMQVCAINQDFSWSASARRYLAMYRELAPMAVTVHGERDSKVIAHVVASHGARRAAAA